MSVVGGKAAPSWIGARIRRKEDRRLLTGRGKFAADVRLPDMLSAVIFRSPHAHARIRSLDLDAARRVSGVVAAWGAADLADVGRIPMRMSPRAEVVQCLQRPIAIDKVRYVGEPMAVILATDRYRAEDALETVAVEFEELRPVTNAVEALAPGAPIIHEGFGRNLAERIVMNRGDAQRALGQAAVRVAHRFQVQRHTGVPMETRGLLARYDVGTGVLTMWGPTKVPHYNRSVLARLLGIPDSRVHFLPTDVGGGFGVRGEFYPEDFLFLGLAIRVGRPVRWVEDRREHLRRPTTRASSATSRHRGYARTGRSSLSTTGSGTTWGRTSGPTASSSPDRTAADVAWSLSCPALSRRGHLRVHQQDAGRHLSGARPLRGDVRARADRGHLPRARSALDPADVRRRNFMPSDAMPYDLGTTAR